MLFINKGDMKYINNYLIIVVILISQLDLVNAQQGQLSVTLSLYDSTGSVNPYFLIMLFWLVAMLWPALRWIYSTFIERAVNRVKERVESMAHQLSERISAAGRKLSETIKS